MIHPSGVHNRCPSVSENTLTPVGEDVAVFLAVRNRTANENLILHSKTVLGKAQSTTFMFRPIMVDQTGKTPVCFVEHFNNIDVVDFALKVLNLVPLPKTFYPPSKCPKKVYLKMRNLREPIRNC